MKRILLALMLLATTAQAADRYEVHPGCEKPVFAADAKTFYFDPVNGSLQGDGSQAKPFPGLEASINAGLIDTWSWQRTFRTDANGVKTTWFGYPDTLHGEKLNKIDHANKNWKVPQGSHLMLMTGDHGNPVFKSYWNDTTWAEIAAADGQKPVVHSLTFVGGNRWAIRGITCEANPGKNCFTVTEGGFFGPTHDFAMSDLFATSPGLDPHETDKDTLRTKVGANAFFIRDSECASVVNSGMYMMQAGIGFYSNRMKESDLDNNVDRGLNKVLARNTELAYIVGQDGVDFAGYNGIVDGIYMHDGIDSGTGLHFDGMQGQPNSGKQEQVSAHWKFTNNRIIRQTDAKLKYPTYLQGMSAFDGQWDDVLVENNLIVTEHWHCSTFSGGSNITWKNNTCLPAGQDNKAYGANQPWLSPWPNKANYIGSNFKFINNVGFQFNVRAPSGVDANKFLDSAGIVSTGNVMSGNVLTLADFNDQQYNADGTPMKDAQGRGIKKLVHRWGNIGTDGTYPDGNVVKKALWADFPNLDRANYKFDLSGVKETSPAFGKGFQPVKPACDCSCK